jgi:hypothetical protein
MPLFRTDRYVRATVADFKLQRSSEDLIAILQKISDLRNVQMTKVRIDREVQGIIKIEEWYEITGAFSFPEGGKSFWVISKPSTETEPYNFFIRVDRNIEAEDYESAQQKTSDWINQSLIKPLERGFSIQNLSISLPEELSRLGRN